MKRPASARMRVANLASVSAGPKKVASILDEALHNGPDVDLLLLVECGDLTIKYEVDPAVWQVIQFGRSLSSEAERVARSGCAMIARRDAVFLDRPSLELAAPAGEGIRDRYVLKARARFHRGRVRRARVRVGHAPPPRAPRGRDRFLDVLRSMRGIRAGDLNIGREWAAELFRLSHVYSAGVIHAVVPGWLPSTFDRTLDVGSDHLALDVILWPPRGGAKD